MACAKSPLGENSPIELDDIRPRPRQDCEANLTALDSENQFREQWERAMTWLVKAWSITCTGCIILLPFPLGFFQIPGIDGNIYARTAVLSMFICSGIGLMTAGFYLQLKGKFKSKGFMKEWMRASQGLRNRDAVDFWTCLCLPVSLFAWAMFFCIVTLLVIIMRINPTNEMEFNQKQVQAWHISSIIFLVTLTVGQVVQVYRFGKLLPPLTGTTKGTSLFLLPVTTPQSCGWFFRNWCWCWFKYFQVRFRAGVLDERRTGGNMLRYQTVSRYKTGELRHHPRKNG
ncbi:hypothetical protein CVT25_005549 [Psilocybe cyanescens]|uniref:Uncharacterized protein n=1 Tax=Psilocybe cyanescens TaxID=93625 RepID=A0A409X696_PSICY|nr:hypothetical protein CVT25_005549 [Psilocybe cyanescens]